jgi:hypothetical protein
LYSAIPAASIAMMQPSAAAARKRASGTFSRPIMSMTRTTIIHTQAARAGSPRSAAICIGLLCRCGLGCAVSPLRTNFRY